MFKKLISILFVFISINSSAGIGRWTVGNGIYSEDVTSLAIDKSDVIYAGTVGHGLLKSIDGGANWSKINTGLSIVPWVTSIAIATSGVIYVGISGGTIDSGGVFKSTNGGASWTNVSSGLPRYSATSIRPVDSITVDANGNVYAGTEGGGVYKSTNGGTSWVAAGVMSLDSVIVCLAIDASGAIYAGSISEGVLKSTDGGNTWISANNGLKGGLLPTVNPKSFSISPNGNIYVQTLGYGVFKSSDGGTSWTNIIQSTSDSGLAVDSSGSVYINSFAFSGGGGIYKTDANGAGISQVGAFPAYEGTNAIAIDSKGTIYVGSNSRILNYTPPPSAARADCIMNWAATYLPTYFKFTGPSVYADATKTNYYRPWDASKYNELLFNIITGDITVVGSLSGGAPLFIGTQDTLRPFIGC